jgi:lactate permease
MFNQILDPLNNIALTGLAALVPVAALLLMLAVWRISAWIAVAIGSLLTFVIAVGVWGMPVNDGLEAYIYGSLTGVWNVDWITLWGVVLFNTLLVTGVFERFRQWLISVGTDDVRVQTMLFAWAFGALLEGLVGFGYPWAVVAPILIYLGIPDLDALRVSALANNAPVSYGALGAPIIGLAAVTQLPLLQLSGSVGNIVAVLALLPPWVLIYLVSGKRGLADGWPLALVGSLAYIAGQWPVAYFLGPYLPDVAGAILCFFCLLMLLKVWRPKEVLGFGGVPRPVATRAPAAPKLTTGELMQAWMPYIILIVVVVAWTGPWSPLPAISWLKQSVSAVSSIAKPDGTHATIVAVFNFAPFVGGSAIFVAWVLSAIALGLKPSQLGTVFSRTFSQMWGAFLVGFFIFGLAYVFNFSGMAASLANAFSKFGTFYIVLAPILGWIGVALSGSNTSTNAMFGQFQVLVGQALGFPALLLPSLNSVGAEIGKPVAPQTASVGVSTSRYVRNEGEVIRYNMGWTFVLLAYLIIIAIGFYFLAPGSMMPH